MVRAREQLGWRPRLRLEQALSWTVDWYREVAQGKPAHATCLGQIEQYMGVQ